MLLNKKPINRRKINVDDNTDTSYKVLTPGNEYNKENMKKCISMKLIIKLILKICKLFILVIMRLLVKNWNTEVKMNHIDRSLSSHFF